MSLLINETFASPDIPLWLSTDLVTSNVGKLVMGSPALLIGSAYFTVGSYTFPTAVNSVVLQGWASIANAGTGTTGTIFLSTSATSIDTSKTTALTGITINATGTTFIQLDNLQYYSATPFTTIYLVVQNTTGTTTGILTPTSASGNATYGTALPLSFSLTSGTGSIVVMGG